MDVSVEVKIEPEWLSPPQSMAEEARRGMIRMKFKNLAFETEQIMKAALLTIVEEYKNGEDADG